MYGLGRCRYCAGRLALILPLACPTRHVLLQLCLPPLQLRLQALGLLVQPAVVVLRERVGGISCST